MRGHSENLPNRYDTGTADASDQYTKRLRK
jgi:hypothetical protein